MSTQVVAISSTSHPPVRPTQNHRQLIRRAERLFQMIGAYSDAERVEELRKLHSYLSQFLALPQATLRAWEADQELGHEQ